MPPFNLRAGALARFNLLNNSIACMLLGESASGFDLLKLYSFDYSLLLK